MAKYVKITNRTKSEILYLLGKLLSNGFSLNHSILCLTMKYPKFNFLFDEIKQSLDSGYSFSENMKLLNLSEMMISQIKLAEQNGLLKQVILQLGYLMGIRNKQVKKIKLLMLYPIFIFAFLILIISFIKVFFTFDYEPTALSYLLEISDWVIISSFLVGLSYGAFQFFKIRHSSESVAVIKRSKLPIFGKVYQKYYEYNLLFSVGLMIKSGMTLSDICAMKFAKESSYFYLQQKLIDHLKKGLSISDFIKSQSLIPNEFDILTDTGLNHMDLGEEILALAQIKYDETLERAQKIITKVQPIVFGVIAILILNTYLKILVPVYGMMEGMY